MKKIIFICLMTFGFVAQAGLSMSDQFVSVSAGLNTVRSETMVEVYYGLEYGSSFSVQGNDSGFLSLGLQSLGTPSGAPLNVGVPFMQMVPYLVLRAGYECMKDRPFSFGVDVSYGIGWMEKIFYSTNSVGLFAKWNLESVSPFLRLGAEDHASRIAFNTDVMPYVHLGIEFSL